MTGFQKVRIGHAGVKHSHKRVALNTPVKRDSDCSASALYISPKASDSVAVDKPVDFAWKTDCLNNTEKVDLYLYASGNSSQLVRLFAGADYQKGSYSATLNPSWWNDTASVSLHLAIVPAGMQNFLSPLPTGPVWTATYDSTNHPIQKDSSGIVQKVTDYVERMSNGAIAAAVLLPLLAVIGVAAFFIVRRSRKKQASKSQRFSQKIDTRMSRISGDWRAMTGAGANIAVRQSMAFPHSTDERPYSGVNQAGFGARVNGSEEFAAPQMRQTRPSFATSGSRVSFAADPRGSIVDKERPPMPRYVRQESDEKSRSNNVDEDLAMSPTQTHGPELLHPGEIVARASTDQDEDFRREVLKMPAMTLMRTNDQSPSNGEFVLAPAEPYTPTQSAPGSGSIAQVVFDVDAQPYSPAYPSPAHVATGAGRAPSSPMGAGMQTYQVLSPDDMLRAYAAGRAPSTPGAGPGGMRVLYQPDDLAVPPSPMTSSTMGVPDGGATPTRKSVQTTRSDYTESMYSGMAEEEQYPAYNPHHQNGGAYGSNYPA